MCIRDRAGPVGPVAPVAPGNPGTPMGPIGPVGPVGPIRPTGPVGPMPQLQQQHPPSYALMTFISFFPQLIEFLQFPFAVRSEKQGLAKEILHKTLCIICAQSLGRSAPVQRRFDGLHLICPFPGNVQILPTHMSIGRQTAVDRPFQVQIPDDRARAQVKDLPHRIGQRGI